MSDRYRSGANSEHCSRNLLVMRGSYGINLADRRDSAGGRGTPQLAIQFGMGILPQRWIRSDSADPACPPAHGQVVGCSAAPELSTFASRSPRSSMLNSERKSQSPIETLSHLEKQGEGKRSQKETQRPVKRAP